MNVASLFLNAAKKYPQHIAIVDQKSSITYQDLEKEVRSTAAYFYKKGIRPSHRVMVFVPMSIELYKTVLALFYLGATAVFLDEWVNRKRLELCCEIADCQGFIASNKIHVLSLISKQIRKIPIKLSISKTINQSIPIENVTKDHPALITFTTGSTGTPKAANRTHGFLNIQFEALIDELEPSANDVDMCTLPIVLFVNLGIGCTSIITDFKSKKPKSLKPKKILAAIESHKVNRITASPYFLQQISTVILQREKQLIHVRKLFTGGAPVFPREAKIIQKAFHSSRFKNSIRIYRSRTH